MAKELLDAAKPDKRCSECKAPAIKMRVSQAGKRYYFCEPCGQKWLKAPPYSPPSSHEYGDHLTEADYQTWAGDGYHLRG